jgi:hypothetical protein
VCLLYFFNLFSLVLILYFFLLELMEIRIIKKINYLKDVVKNFHDFFLLIQSFYFNIVIIIYKTYHANLVIFDLFSFLAQFNVKWSRQNIMQDFYQEGTTSISSNYELYLIIFYNTALLYCVYVILSVYNIIFRVLASLMLLRITRDSQ